MKKISLIITILLFASITSLGQTGKLIKFTSEYFRLMQREKPTDEWNTEDLETSVTIFYDTNAKKMTIYSGDKSTYYDILSVTQENWNDSTSNTVMKALNHNRTTCTINIIVTNDKTLCVHIAFDTLELTYWINATEIRKE